MSTKYFNWLYKCCSAWIDKDHKADFHAIDDRNTLIAAANEKGLTAEQVSQTIHQVNEDRRNEREKPRRPTEDDGSNETTAADIEPEAPAQQHPIRDIASKGQTSASGTRITGAAGGKSIIEMSGR